MGLPKNGYNWIWARGFNVQYAPHNESQRAVIASMIANMKVGDNKGAHRIQEGSANLQTLNNQVSQSEAASMLNVSPRLVGW